MNLANHCDPLRRRGRFAELAKNQDAKIAESGKFAESAKKVGSKIDASAKRHFNRAKSSLYEETVSSVALRATKWRRKIAPYATAALRATKHGSEIADNAIGRNVSQRTDESAHNALTLLTMH